VYAKFDWKFCEVQRERERRVLKKISLYALLLALIYARYISHPLEKGSEFNLKWDFEN